MMKEIAKDCVRLRKELSKKQAQINKMKSAAKKSAAQPPQTTAATSTPATQTSKLSGTNDNATKHIPGTARYSFTKTPILNPEPPPPPPSASDPLSIKKQFPKNPKLQRSSTHVMYAAMGLPEESDRFDTPGSSVSDASAYMYHNPPLSTSSNPNENTPKSSPNPRQLSFSASTFRPKNRSKLATYQLSKGIKTSRAKVPPKLGYTRTPKKKVASLNIFKSSRCSISSLKEVGGDSTKGKNEFDGKRWKSTKLVNTAATTLFKSRFTDNATTAWGKEAYTIFGYDS